MESKSRPLRTKWFAIIIFSLIIAINSLFYYYWWKVPSAQVVLVWLITTTLIFLTSFLAFQHYEKLRNQTDPHLQKIQEQSEHQKALSLLSSVFANNRDESEIYTEIVRRLGALQRYDYVAVYEVTAENQRTLRSNFGAIMDEEPVLYPGEGLSERPLLDGKLHYTPDISQEPVYVPGLGQGSEIDAPIRYQDEILGVLIVESNNIEAFNQEDFDLISTAADQTATAIKNARLYCDALASADRLRVLHRVSQEVIGAGTDPEKIYQSIHNAVTQLMPCEAFAISIFDHEQDNIEAVYLVDRGVRASPRRIPKNTGLSGYVISTGNAVLEDNYAEANGLKDVEVIHFGNPEHALAIIAVPMRLGDSVFGMLSAQSYKTHIYTNEDRNLLEMLSAYAAIALDNANLFNKVQRLAITDGLTEVNNRRFFFEIARREFARSTRYGYPLSVIMIDLDNYKTINDQLGHTIGDIVLREVAQRLKGNTRASDILGRYGGDEFAIILPQTGLRDAMETAERLREDLSSDPVKVDDQTFHLTISLGVSSLSDEVEDLIELLRFADEALYEAKNAGKNCVRSHSF